MTAQRPEAREHPAGRETRPVDSGIDVPESAIWTSALATAQFLVDQRPGGSAEVVDSVADLDALVDPARVTDPTSEQV